MNYFNIILLYMQLDNTHFALGEKKKKKIALFCPFARIVIEYFEILTT